MTGRADGDGGPPVPGGPPRRGIPDAPAAPTGLDVAVRIVGGTAAVWGAAVAAVLEVFLVPLRLGDVRLPVSLVLAVASNLGFMYATKWVTGNKFVALLPGLVWFVVTIVLSGQTSEGDTLLIGGDWMPLALLLIGAGSVAVGAYLTVAPHHHPDRISH